MALNGYRFRLYPAKEQEQILLRWIGCQRLIYNAKVSEDRYFRVFQRKALGMTGRPVPVDQKYSHFKTELTPFLREVPSQVLRNGAALFRQAYQRFFQGLGGRPKHKRRSGEQSVWLTSELFSFEPDADPDTGEVLRYRLHVGTARFPAGEIVYKAHRPLIRVPASIHISVHGGRWFVSFSADDPALGLPDADKDRAIEQIAEKLRQMPREDLAVRTCGADRGGTRPLATSDGRAFDLKPVQKDRGYTHPDNRKTQSEFVCLRCGHTDNADHNAARVLAPRGIKLLLSGASLTKAKKTARIFRNNDVGPERSELTPGETRIRRGAGQTRSAHKSMSQELPVETPETPATAQSA